jgi:catechol 2,3-dioxygenase-like lactoylglutathione lyase family enzyme
MVKLDHLTIRVRDLDAARRWYGGHLGMKLEFEVPGGRTAALQDGAGLPAWLPGVIEQCSCRWNAIRA